MSSKFRISKQRQKDNLHLRLAGDFNDISICELLDVLKDNCIGTNQVFIHTDNLENVSISGIGRDVFRRNLRNLSSSSINIRFPEVNGNPFASGAL
ncbi:MAG: hypothetical protein C4522_10485 [Desulfobacteraceae bacterium]|nr:MAG: hypothetical protein C4522_10485 [Desulfobacteraceae bacterium]